MRVKVSERRSSSRNRAFLKGVIYYDRRRTSLDCLVRDISAEGARLKLPHGPAVTPEAFELYLPYKDESFCAHVEWRAGNEIGVTFEIASAEAPPLAPATPLSPLSPFVPDAAPARLAARVNKLESDLSALQRKVNELASMVRPVLLAE
jgi:hypothetical protein